MAESVFTNFPSQVVSDTEKESNEYGLEIAKAIENEWFHGQHANRYYSLKNRFHELRLYARGEQGVQKYKDELSINGDLSYLNLDWTPVPIIPKFVDIVVNGMSQRNFEVKAYSQDRNGIVKRTEYMESLLKDMRSKDFNDMMEKNSELREHLYSLICEHQILKYKSIPAGIDDVEITTEVLGDE